MRDYLLILMNILFICNQGKHRSRTAELLFKGVHDTRSAGLFNNKVTAEQLSWADLVIVMEDAQRKEIAQRFPKEYLQKKILSWQIPDIYSFNQPELLALLQLRFQPMLNEL